MKLEKQTNKYLKMIQIERFVYLIATIVCLLTSLFFNPNISSFLGATLLSGVSLLVIELIYYKNKAQIISQDKFSFKKLNAEGRKNYTFLCGIEAALAVSFFGLIIYTVCTNFRMISMMFNTPVMIIAGISSLIGTLVFIDLLNFNIFLYFRKLIIESENTKSVK